MKKILVLGSTGSIGKQTLEVIQMHPDKFQLVGIVCHSSTDLLNKQIKLYKPQHVGLFNKKLSSELKKEKGIEYYFGEDEILHLVRSNKYDVVVVAIAGSAALKPTIEAIHSGKNIALATKEILVMAGEIIMNKINNMKEKINLLPIDSEHSAIWQSLRAGNKKELEKIILTCSGGPFRDKSINELQKVTVEQALNHPNWKMGRKITIDSATLMNKGLEIIEAKWLFDLTYSQIEVVIHPQSILHSAVQFKDGATIGQLGLCDTKIPIQYALSYPERFTNNLPRLSFAEIQTLSFHHPDMNIFRCLKLAYEAIKIGGSMPIVLNAADETVVKLFLNGKIKFLDIPKIIELTMEKHNKKSHVSLNDVYEIDSWSRRYAEMIH